jgi:hypothetical protein
MRSQDLTARSFEKYSQVARTVAKQHLEQLKQLPVPLLVSFLAEIIIWERKFPAERDQLTQRLEAIEKLPGTQLHQLLRPFSELSLPPNLDSLDWLNAPAVFLQQLTAYLWSSRKIDEYRAAAQSLMDALTPYIQLPEAQIQRLAVIIGGPELVAAGYPLFTHLRTHGLYAMDVDPNGSEACLTAMLASRATQHSAAYSHWCLDTALSADCPFKVSGSTYISYHAAEPVRSSVVKAMQRAVMSGVGPEVLRSQLAALTASECHADAVTPDPLLQHFIVDLFANGSGTQIYSTSFVQWAAREILRRSQPATLIIRIGPRVRQRSLNDFISGSSNAMEVDTPGSAIDADVAAYYTWLELGKLGLANNNSTFLTWFVGHRQAFLSGPGVPRNVSTPETVTIPQLLKLADMAAI